MRFLLLVITLLTTLVPTELKSAPFTEDQNIQKQYEEFRQLDDADRHQTINSDDELAEAYLVYGQRALEAGDVENAINYFRAGSELKPDDGRFSTMLGLTYSRIDERHLAEMSLLEAILLLPTAMEPRQILADHYYQ